MNELARCPICGEKPDYLMGNLAETEFKVGCSQCHVFTVAPNGKRAQEMWNDICSKEVGEEPELKPCPFCGSTDIHLVENDRGKSEVSITCKDCNVWVDHMFYAMTREQAIKLWNRRVKE